MGSSTLMLFQSMICACAGGVQFVGRWAATYGRSGRRAMRCVKPIVCVRTGRVGRGSGMRTSWEVDPAFIYTMSASPPPPPPPPPAVLHSFHSTTQHNVPQLPSLPVHRPQPFSTAVPRLALPTCLPPLTGHLPLAGEPQSFVTARRCRYPEWLARNVEKVWNSQVRFPGSQLDLDWNGEVARLASCGKTLRRGRW